MAETSSNENEKPVAPASKKPSKKDEPKDTIWSRRDFFVLLGGLDLRRHWVFQLCFSRVFFFPAFSSNLLQFLRRVALVITL